MAATTTPFYEKRAILLDIQQFDVKRQPSIRRNIATSPVSTVPVNHIPSKRFKTKHHNQENKLSRNMIYLYPIDGGIVSFLLSPTRIPVGIPKQKLKIKKHHMMHILNIVKKTSWIFRLPLTPTSHPLMTCPTPTCLQQAN